MADEAKAEILALSFFNFITMSDEALDYLEYCADEHDVDSESNYEDFLKYEL